MTGTIRATRKAITDRLGLPAEATDAQILAEFDARKASTESADDRLYAAAFGEHQQEAPAETLSDLERLAGWV